VSDEDRDGRIVREHREKLAGELSALIEDQGQAGDFVPPENVEDSGPDARD